MKKILLSVREDFLKSRNEWRDSVDQSLIKWILSLNIFPIIVSNITNRKFLKKIKTDGVIISGGSTVNVNSKRYNIDKYLINWAQKNNKPLLGICYGLQILSVLDGIKLKKIKGHVNKKTKINSKLKYKFPEKVKCFHDLGFKSSLNNYYVTATDEHGIVEAIKHKKFNCHGWMWHPEREKVFDKKLIQQAKNIFFK